MPRSIRLRSVAPAPISMSSECAPRQSTDSRSPGAASCRAFMASRRGAELRAHAPGHVAAIRHFLQQLPVSEGVHRTPETLIFIGHEMAACDQTFEGLMHQFLALPNEVEDLVAENKKPSVDPDLGLLARTQPLDRTTRIKLRQMEADRRMNGDKAADLSALLEHIDHHVQRGITQPIAVVGEKYLFILDKVPDGDEALPDIAPGSRVHERNAPVRWSFTENFDLLAEFGDDAVAARGLLVVQEVVLDDVRLVSKAENEISMAILAVILHDMPQDRLMRDRPHPLGNTLR